MNDQFLYGLLPEPNQAFAEKFYAHLQAPPSPRQRLEVFLHTRLGIVTSLLALVLVAFAAYQIISPNFQYEANIGGIDIYEMDYRIVMKPYWASSPPSGDTPDPFAEPGEPAVPPDLISVYSAMGELPYTIQLPTYLPKGIQLYERTYNNPSFWEDFFFLNWSDDGQERRFVLFVHQVGEMTSEEIRLAPGKWEQIDLNGTPAILVRGDFEPPFDSYEEYMAFQDAEQPFTYAYWNDDLGLRILWITDGVFYELSSPFPSLGSSTFRLEDTLDYLYPTISEEELINIAESMIP